MKKIFIFLIVFFLLFRIAGNVMAEDSKNNQFVTIVNPIRISSYNKNQKESLLSEYQVVKDYKLPATWLITYDVLEKENLMDVLKKMDKDQEIGIFLEVTDNFSKKSDVLYNNTGFWHHANSVFLSGYKKEDGIKLIDTVFSKFKKEFGYYPTSVGSWWTDSFSLTYMKEKYGVTANLGCSDQFSTDGYKIWGQPFSIPFFPSKYHTGIPASDNNDRVGVVNFLWAPRDPLNGYYNSLFSTQDYLVAGKGLDTDYFKKLVSLYAFKNNNSFGQITVGLEGDLDPSVYQKEYKKQLSYIEELVQKGEVQVLSMSDFSDWFSGEFNNQDPVNLIETKDFLGTNNFVTWFQNSKYRFSYEENEDGEIEIRDFRIYDKNIIEPYYISPNRDFNLTINTPFVIDKVGDPNNIWILKKGSEISFEDTKVIIKTESKIPDFIEKNRYINISKTKDEIIIEFKDFNYSKDGEVLKDYSIEARHILKSPKTLLKNIIGGNLSFLKKISYFIPQEEIVALNFLYTQQEGKVLVFNKECLQCSYSSDLKPLVFSNSRDYVKKISGKKIIYDPGILENSKREELKEKIQKLGVKYIYLVRFEDYKEEIPYSPGDLGVEKIFENANAQIWIVK